MLVNNSKRGALLVVVWQLFDCCHPVTNKVVRGQVKEHLHSKRGDLLPSSSKPRVPGFEHNTHLLHSKRGCHPGTIEFSRLIMTSTRCIESKKVDLLPSSDSPLFDHSKHLRHSKQGVWSVAIQWQSNSPFWSPRTTAAFKTRSSIFAIRWQLNSPVWTQLATGGVSSPIFCNTACHRKILDKTHSCLHRECLWWLLRIPGRVFANCDV